MVKKLTILSALLFIFLYAKAGISKDPPYISVRLTIVYGSNIPFNFNTMDKIRNGIEITNGTVLGISIADSNQVEYDLEGFVLNFGSFNGQSVIQGDVPTNTILLDRIRVKAEIAQGLVGGTPEVGYQDLTSSLMPLFSYSQIPWITDLNWADDQLLISYDCGNPAGHGTLLGEEPDFYKVEIEFELVPTGSGF